MCVRLLHASSLAKFTRNAVVRTRSTVSRRTEDYSVLALGGADVAMIGMLNRESDCFMICSVQICRQEPAIRRVIDDVKKAQ